MNKGDLNMDDAIFDFAFSMALGDATRRVAEDSDKDLGNDNVKNEVKKYVDTIIKGSKGVNFDSTVNKIQEFNQDFTFGKIQKLINMTMKYLYIKYYDNSEVRERYSQCYAPLDSLMRDFVYKSYYYFTTDNNRKPNNVKAIFDPECSWSKIGKPDYKRDDYDNYQEAIKKLIEIAKDKGLLINNKIEFDYLFWGEAKKLRDKNTTIDKIWENVLKT